MPNPRPPGQDAHDAEVVGVACTSCDGTGRPDAMGFAMDRCKKCGGSGMARDVVAEITAERRRQIEAEGWSIEHDDVHISGEMAQAAAAYAAHAGGFRDAAELGGNYRIKAPHPLWPWSHRWWKPKDPRRDLIRAAALIVAEIERLDRLAASERTP